ncbi:N-acetyl sugar amidotransferase [Candidatus Pelagibacter communis]|uniref:N-acetyl sugar amidotransferase n=1 Tax=Pelagibacter ubique TaxID=198252 RepID=UPI0009E3844A|nr:N-acetyl sugar amidotransferase [Candidatus Pelagibacter ubique]
MVEFCKICIMPNSRPRITFDKDGICNACNHSKDKEQINWELRKEEFLEILSNLKKIKNRNKLYDCVVPWSGGKDSSSIAHKLKFNFGLNPLLVTFSPLIPNEIGEHNRKIMSDLGFDTIFFKPKENISKLLSQRFFKERGNPKVAWDAGINSLPIKIAIEYKIPYVFYAEHGESEYGGLMLNKESLKRRDLREVIEHQIGDYPQNWVNEKISLKDLAPYVYPEKDEFNKFKVEALYFSYFFKWSMLENFEYIKKNVKKFKTIKDRTDGTFTNFDSLDDKIDNIYYYLQFVKFGFGRATRDSCRMIQNKQMTRDEAIQKAKKYDNEFPNTYFKDVLNFLEINQNQFDEIVNLHRNDEIWEIKNNVWNLKNTVYAQ